MTSDIAAQRQAKIAARRKRLVRLMEENPNGTYDQWAEELNVDRKTIQRDVAVLKTENRVPVKVTPTPAERRHAEAINKTLDTYAVVSRTLAGLEKNLGELEREIGFEGDKCECCGRKPMKDNPLHWQNLTKFYDSITNAAKLQGQLLGQLETNVVVIRQADLDVMTIIETLANIQSFAEEEGFTLDDRGTVDVSRVTMRLAREIYQRLLGSNPSRQKRLPGFSSVVDGEFRELPALPEGETDGDRGV